MKKALVIFLLATNAYGYNPATREQQVEQTALLEDIKTNTAGGGGGGGNASVGTNGAAAPGSSTQLGFDSGGNLVSVSATNPLPITGAISATNPSVATADGAIPTDATMIGGSDGSNLRPLSVNSSGILALPQGASTAANQTTANSSLSSIDGKTPSLVSGRVPVDGSGVTQPISASSLPLPTGAATSTAQTTGNASLASIDGHVPQLTLDHGASTNALRVVTSDDSSIAVTTAPGQYSDSIYQDYGDICPCDPGDPVDIGVLSADTYHLHIFDSSGHTVELLADGNRVYLIPPGGPSAVVDLFIASGTTLSIAPVDGTSITTGSLVITGLE